MSGSNAQTNAARLFDSFSQPVLLLDENGRIRYANVAARQFLAIDPDSREFAWTDLPLLESDEKTSADLLSVLRREHTWQGTITSLSPTGERRFFAVEANRLAPAPGETGGYLFLFREAPDDNRAGEVYHALVDQSLQALIIIQDGRIVFANQATADLSGYSIAELLAMAPWQMSELIHPEDRIAVQERHQRRLNEASVLGRYEYRGVHRDGGIFWVETYSVKIMLGGRPAVQSTLVDITARKNAEEALRRSEEKYRLITETANEIIFIHDLQGRIIYINRHGLTVSGYDAEEIKEVNLRSFFPPEEIAAEEQRMAKRFAGDFSTFIFEVTMLDRHGKRIPLEVYSTPYLEDGEIKGIFVIARDITGRKKSEAAVHLNEARLTALLEVNQKTGLSFEELMLYALEQGARLTDSPIGYLALLDDAETTLTMYAWTKSAMAQCALIDKPQVYRLEDTGLWGEAVRQRRPIITNDYPAPHPWKKGYPKGHVPIRRHMNIPVFDGDKIVLLAGVGNKVDEYDETDVKQLTLMMEGIWRLAQRKRASDLIEENEARYRVAAQATGQLIYDYQPQARRIQWSGAIEAISGYPPEEFQQFDFDAWREMVHPDDLEDVLAELAEAQQNSRELRVVYRFRRRDGVYLHIESRGTFLKDETGKPYRLLGAMKDITEIVKAQEEKRQFEEQLRQAQKMDSIGKLAGGIAHDFNNILTGITGYAEIILGSVSRQDPIYNDLSEIKKAADRASALTAQLLAFSRKQIIDPKIIDLNELVANSTRMIERLIGEDISLLFRPAPDLGFVRTDPSQIEQILINLAVNARDAMPGGGKLVIETANRIIDEEFCRRHIDVKAGDYVMLGVTDNGCGMSEEVQARLFEPFFTTKGIGKGTGLGLSTVYGIVKQNEGFIDVASRPGKGSSFKIYLPLASGQPEAYATSVRRDTPRGGETILLVEDEEMVRNLAQKVLERQGYKIKTAASGGEAFLLAQDLPERVHLLLTDVIIPHMNGRQLYDRLRERDPELRVLFMSGYTENIIEHQGALDPDTNFIAKPFSIEVLVRKVREVLDD
ncbi:MAG: PAS domain S-box protein [Myxococcales bacterium]|nr:PAS domain S-box protein [Myxococcales bacterium]